MNSRAVPFLLRNFSSAEPFKNQKTNQNQKHTRESRSRANPPTLIFRASPFTSQKNLTFRGAQNTEVKFIAIALEGSYNLAGQTIESNWRIPPLSRRASFFQSITSPTKPSKTPTRPFRRPGEWREFRSFKLSNPLLTLCEKSILTKEYHS